MALIGNHKINYRAPGNTGLMNLHFNARLEFEETNYQFVKNFGTDTWTLYIGQILSTMVDGLNNKSSVSTKIITLQNLAVLSFKKGLMQWSAHLIKIKLDYAVSVDSNIIKSGSVSEDGSGSGGEFGLLTFIPILGNVNFDKGIELVVYRSLEKCLFRISEEIKSVL